MGTFTTNSANIFWPKKFLTFFGQKSLTKNSDGNFPTSSVSNRFRNGYSMKYRVFEKEDIHKGLVIAYGHEYSLSGKHMVSLSVCGEMVASLLWDGSPEVDLCMQVGPIASDKRFHVYVHMGHFIDDINCWTAPGLLMDIYTKQSTREKWIENCTLLTKTDICVGVEN